MKVVYSKEYGVSIGEHPWHTSKYALVLDRLKTEGLIAESDVIETPMANDKDILRVHTLEYWQKLCDLNFSEEDVERAEIPVG